MRQGNILNEATAVSLATFLGEAIRRGISLSLSTQTNQGSVARRVSKRATALSWSYLRDANEIGLS
jgi:hypothetical protein